MKWSYGYWHAGNKNKTVQAAGSKKGVRVQFIAALTNLVQHLGEQLLAGDPAHERAECCLGS